ncbi:hypothetical protein A3H78_06080 [Candidatus Roizmanbacteria bacterium RIFCSPLOWO2_02_FULL_36_11]|uniref:Glutamine amidotransferase type-2 domain-containing protein n=1 Tax=Candidatus Roizmanbacteria bacterium RIFCSPLOWO2_02_FULL_36_11 TaxID=1802071 RepID=A0A1F7JFR1_9BACT|nr:MAG: hypothetical protein A3H78_06080 [Candidatus Roizmanbacteria bacterium RIFCSPLOWO2_02_FULL_36_11]
MCRFLMVRSKKPIKLVELLSDFAFMCKKSVEWQGDGWGISWRVDNGGWRMEKSLKPIWDDVNIFDGIPESNIIVVHARGASFPKHKNNINYNQPYIDSDMCFVFNGELYGVRLYAEGQIGSQKIFSLIKKNLDKNSPINTLKKLRNMLINNSSGILGCNIGLVINDKFYASCFYSKNKEYYTLRYFSDDSVTIVCSEKINKFLWRSMKKGDIIQI